MKSFYAFFKGAIAILVLASMTMVSCHEPYDDTALRQEIANIYEKLGKLEEKLDTEVAALKTLIDSKTVVASATKNTDGSWDILLTTGEKITVYPEYKPTAEVNNGCITVIKEGNTYYWAQIVDGAAVAIVDAAGNKVPVAHNATPELRVNPATGDVEISVDGGKTWIVVEKAEEEEVQMPTCIFIGVEDGETSIDFYLATGEIISVPKAETIDFGVQAGKTFVTPGESVEVALKANNIEDLTVIAKPEGWKATINGKVLTVTAPAQEKIDAGEAEKEGTIKIHASADGKCMVGKLPVSASTENVILEISGEDLVIYNNVLSQWGDANPVYYGIVPMSEFNAAAIAKGMNDYTTNYMYTYDTFATVSIKAIYNEMLAGVWNEAQYVDVPTGESYIIWAISEGPGTWSNPYVYSESDVMFVVYTPSFLKIEATSVAFNEVEITANGGGHAGYVVGVIGGNSAEEVLGQLENSFGYWQMGWGAFGEEIDELNFSGSISSFPGAYFEAIYPNTTYLVYALPLVDGKAEGDYLFTDIKTCSIATPNIEAGGTATLSFEAVNTTYTNIEVAINGSANTALIYSIFAEEAEIAAYQTDEELLNYVIQYNTAYNNMAVGNSTAAYISSLAPGASAYVCAFAVDTDGKYGKLYKQEFKTNSLSYNESIKVAIDAAACKVETTTAQIKVSATGGNVASYRYMAVETSGYSWKGESDAEGKLALNNNWLIEEVAASSLVDGYINLSELETNLEYAFAVVAVDESGAPSRAAFYYFTPKLPEYPLIRANSESYAAMKPTFDYNVEWNGDYGCFNVTVNVTPAAGTAKYWIAVPDSTDLPADSPARDIVDFMILKEGQYYGSKSFTEAGTLVPDYKVGRTYDVNANIFIVWMDEAGNYYEAVSAPIFTAKYVPETELSWVASQPMIVATLSGDTLSYTVTPGAGAKEMYILAVPNRLYYDADTTTYMLSINPAAVKSSVEYSGTLAGVPEEATVAVAWTDEAGNIYQAKTVVRP